MACSNFQRSFTLHTLGRCQSLADFLTRFNREEVHLDKAGLRKHSIFRALPEAKRRPHLATLWSNPVYSLQL
jgi:hypothetical protein